MVDSKSGKILDRPIETHTHTYTYVYVKYMYTYKCIFTFHFKGHMCGRKHGLQSQVYNWSIVQQPDQKRLFLLPHQEICIHKYVKIKCSDLAGKQSREEVKGRDRGANTWLYL